MPVHKPARTEVGQMGRGINSTKDERMGEAAPFEFTAWTADNHLRHSRFVALRDGPDIGHAGGVDGNAAKRKLAPDQWTIGLNIWNSKKASSTARSIAS